MDDYSLLMAVLAGVGLAGWLIAANRLRDARAREAELRRDLEHVRRAFDRSETVVLAQGRKIVRMFDALHDERPVPPMP